MVQAKHNEKQTCPRCHLGALAAKGVTYSAVYRGALFSVPEVPAWQCDICAYIEYDDNVMARLEGLVGETLLPHEPVEAEAKMAPIEAEGESADTKSRSRLKR